jgi:hypothetical protein
MKWFPVTSVSFRQLLFQTQHLPQQNQPARRNKSRTQAKQRTHIKRNTYSKNKHKITQKNTSSTVMTKTIAPTATKKHYIS